MSEQQHPPYPPAPPYPQQGPAQMPPRPAGVPPMGMPPHPPGMKMPPGVKMPPRPMGGYPMPPGVKMPPRPAGVPPMGVPPAVMPPPAPVVSELPVPNTIPAPDALEEDVDAMWGKDEPEQQEELGSKEQPPVVDENGFIDDLAEDEAEAEDEEDETQDDESVRFEPSPYEHNMASDLGLPPVFVKTKMLLPLFFLFLICGGLLGFFAGSMQNKGNDEMPGVVHNAEIPKGRPRCGIAQKGQGCVLYLMNAQRREIEAKEFFSMASDVLGIPKFQIETANIRYSTMRIPPGYIALLNIPPVQ